MLVRRCDRKGAATPAVKSELALTLLSENELSERRACTADGSL